MPEFKDAKLEDYEFRNDGKVVRKDRWEKGIYQIQGIIGSCRREFEIDDVIEAVYRLKGNWLDADPEEDPGVPLIDLRLSCGTILTQCERRSLPFTYHWEFGIIDFTSKDFGADVIEWQESPPQPAEAP
jgi:hypothetical protein